MGPANRLTESEQQLVNRTRLNGSNEQPTRRPYVERWTGNDVQ